MPRCDYCRTPCGWHSFPGLQRSSSVVSCLPCWFDPEHDWELDYEGDPVTDWLSDEEDNNGLGPCGYGSWWDEFSEEDEESEEGSFVPDTELDSDGEAPSPLDEPEPEPEPDASAKRPRLQ